MKKLVTSLVAISCASMLLVSCGGKKDKVADAGVATGYTFGEEQTFRSDEKVNYSIFFSDASWYPKL